MPDGPDAAQGTTLRDYLVVARRRKWIIVQSLVLVPAAAIAFSLHQQKLYRASAEVLLSTQNLAAALTGTSQTGITQDPTRIADTQAEVARVPTIAGRVLARAPGTGLTVDGFLRSSSVAASTDADILDFTVTNRDPALAERLVDLYASAYTVYRRQLDTASIQRALNGVNAQIAKLGDVRHSALYAGLVDRQQTLVTMQALQTSNAQVVQRANGTTLTQPKTVRNAVLGVVLGLVLGLGLAFLWEALDTRVRSAQEIGERLGGLPLLARLPEPGKRLREADRLVMLSDPGAAAGEAFRLLRTNIAFVTMGRDVRTVMVTSAVEQEGKSTTIANLAVALARGGTRVALVDLDLRRPILARFFDLFGPGLTEVALGRATLDEALEKVAITTPRDGAKGGGAPANGNGGSNGTGRAFEGVLEVLPAGPLPPDPGEFVGSPRLADILAELRERFDVVLIDAPPMLHVSDAQTLSTRVDSIFLTTKLRLVRRGMLAELHRQLQSLPTQVLGFALTGAEAEDGYGEGYSGYYGYERRPAPAERESGKAASGV